MVSINFDLFRQVSVFKSLYGQFVNINKVNCVHKSALIDLWEKVCHDFFLLFISSKLII